jgi:hypothetical protein
MATASAAGTSDFIRMLALALMRYPEHRALDPGIIKALGRVFRPRVMPGEPFPVVGVAADQSGAVHILMSQPDVKISEDHFEEFFGMPPVPVLTNYVGVFEPCAGAKVHVVPGNSISYGAEFSDTGTLGCIVNDVARNEYLLSCNHIIANYNNAALGDPIWMPGCDDGGSNDNTIGLLHDFEPLHFGGLDVNYMDAAIARPVPGIMTYRGIDGGVGVVGGTDERPEYNIPVRKYGRTSHLTYADLTFQKLSLKLSYRQGTALFFEQYGVVESMGGKFAEPGDSGALVVNSRNEAVGLLFCKASVGNLAVVSPIGPILTRFGVSL